MASKMCYPTMRQEHIHEIGIRFLWKEGIAISLILGLQMIGPPAIGAISFLALIIWAIRSSKTSVQSLCLSILIVFINPGIVPEQPMIGILKWVLLFVAVGRVLPCRLKYIVGASWFVYFILFAFVSLLMAVIISASPIVSVMKLLSFTVTASTSLVIMRDRSSGDYWPSWFCTIGTVVLLLSLPLIALPAGYFRNSWAFQGILNQPQAYGVYMVPLLTYLAFQQLVSTDRSLVWLSIIITGFVTVILSASRTALFATCASTFLSLLVALFYRRDFLNGRLRKRIGVSLMIIVIIIAAFGNVIRDQAISLLAKHYTGGNESLVELFISSATASRGQQIEEVLNNIYRSPFTGAGFGMGSDESIDTIEDSSLQGIPLSAPTEQGFLPIAMLGQLGIIGTLPLCMFFFLVAFRIIKYGSLPIIALFLCALCINFGEMVFFSAGGLGLFIWLIFGFCYSSTYQRVSC